MSAILHTEANRPRYFLVFGALILSAWVGLALWGRSPYAYLLDHARMDEVSLVPILRLAVFALGWTLMIVAMMLPGTLPLVTRCFAQSQHSIRTIAQIVLAYLAVWVMFGCVAYLADSVLHEIVEHVSSVAGVVAPGVLFLAGAYQLTPWKDSFLSRCRPATTVLNNYSTASPARWQALHLGLEHSTFCLGSCWALMLLMFAVGGANFAWMLALGTVMAAERITSRGDVLARLLGVTLVMWSFLMILR
jgi:predicted metal-binding membrane protein